MPMVPMGHQRYAEQEPGENFTEKLYEDEWKNPIEVEHGNTPIAFSPDFILNNRFSFSHKDSKPPSSHSTSASSI